MGGEGGLSWAQETQLLAQMWYQGVSTVGSQTRIKKILAPNFPIPMLSNLTSFGGEEGEKV